MANSKVKVRGVASKNSKLSGFEPASRPAIKIIKCIGFQKFRYCGENRPGKKYQDKDFMQLALCHLSGKNVRIQIVCFDAERQHEIHPNGLVGKDCKYGVYDKVYPISKTTQIVRIPYLRTERILTKKIKQEEGHVKSVFTDRAQILPTPYSEQCQIQAELNQKYDTTRVCFGVIASVDDLSAEPLFCLSNVVQNASEKTMLKIHKLSTQYVSAQEGGEVDIFTSDDGPPITAGKCSVKVIVCNNDGEVFWESPEITPSIAHILYKRVVTYRVPAYRPNPATDCIVRGVIALSCTQSGQTCSVDFCYEPGADSARRLATIHSNKPLRKRPYVSEPSDEEKYSDDIKWRVKEKVRSRQQAETLLDLSRSEVSLPSHSVAVTNGLNAMLPVVPSEQDVIPLHQQDDIVLAKDMVTGQVVYIRAPQAQTNTSDLVVYVQDGIPDASTNGLTMLSEASRIIPVSTEWSEGATLSTPIASTSVVRTMEPVSHVRRSTMDQTPGPSSRKRSSFVSPWIVAEPVNTPLINGDISFMQPKESSAMSGSAITIRDFQLKCEPTEMGPPILPPGQNVHISSETVPGMSHNLPSGALISSANLPSLGSLLASGVLEGVKFDETGTLLSSSVFEMVRPYM
ncbi:hypothetical protein ACOMHN_040449 [Nucella lapillus]